MSGSTKTFALALGLIALLAACEPKNTPPEVEFTPVYKGITRSLLDVDLVNMHVTMTGARDNEDLATYARCAVAQYALKRGYGFARHVRTNVSIESGLWVADAVYTISSTLPQGLRTIDAEITVQDCEAQGIPTV